MDDEGNVREQPIEYRSVDLPKFLTLRRQLTVLPTDYAVSLSLNDLLNLQ